MNKRKKATEILESLTLWIPDGWRKLGPGQVILRLSKEQRDILKNLKSDDLVSLRPDSLYTIEGK